MTYTVRNSNGDIIASIQPGSVNTSNTSLSLVGQGVVGYGEIIAENLVHITENFASDNAPSNPLRGQLWVDTAAGVSINFNAAAYGETPDWQTLALATQAAPSGISWLSGSGDPNNDSNLDDTTVGSLYSNLTGGAGEVLWVKEALGAAGWVAK